jgi:hypothetical protein
MLRPFGSAILKSGICTIARNPWPNPISSLACGSACKNSCVHRVGEQKLQACIARRFRDRRSGQDRFGELRGRAGNTIAIARPGVKSFAQNRLDAETLHVLLLFQRRFLAKIAKGVQGCKSQRTNHLSGCRMVNFAVSRIPFEEVDADDAPNRVGLGVGSERQSCRNCFPTELVISVFRGKTAERKDGWPKTMLSVKPSASPTFSIAA